MYEFLIFYLIAVIGIRPILYRLAHYKMSKTELERPAAFWFIFFLSFLWPVLLILSAFLSIYRVNFKQQEY